MRTFKNSLQFQYNRGFTLIELVVVIAILGILATVLITLINPATQIQKANDTKRKNDLAQLQRALEIYYQDYNKYPNYDSGNYEMQCANGTDVAWGVTTGCWSVYQQIPPKDPTSYSYVYVVTDSPANQTYRLYAHLERGTQDSQACAGNVCANAPNANTQCGGTCNYGVSSSNISP